MGRISESEQASQALIAAFRDEVWSYINWGDLYHWPDKDAWPADYDRAEYLYCMALNADIDDKGRDIVQERIEALARTRSERGTRHTIG